MSPGRLTTRILLAALAMCAGSVVHPAAQRQARGSSFDEIYKRGIQLNAQLKTLTADFTETTTSTILTRPLTASGTLAVERPSRIVLHYLAPERRDVLLEGDRMTMSWPSRQIREVTNIAAANRRIQRYFVEASPDRLRDNFTIVSGTASDRPHAYQITLTAKRQQIKDGLTSLELWVDDGSLLLTAMKMTFPNGDVKLMALDSVVVNQPVAPSVFSAAK